jgi:hypothetical protein
VARVAAEPYLLSEFNQGVGEDALHARALDLARRERMAGDDGRGLAEHGRDPLRGELAAIEYAEISELTRCAAALVAMAEIVLSASVELDIRRERGAVLLEKAREPPEVVVVPVAHDQGVEFFGMTPVMPILLSRASGL